MIPINNKCLKQQEDLRTRRVKEQDIRLSQIHIPDHCPQMQNHFQMMENYFKNQFDLHDSHNLIGIQGDQYFYDHNFPRYLNSSIWNQQFYNPPKIKREEYYQPKIWGSQMSHIKDQESPSSNLEQGFQACEIPKQQQLEYHNECNFEDPNKFLGPCLLSSRQEKNLKRKQKVHAYLQKKNQRSFEKKIIYKCRKQVADNRVRFRGRFISKSQAEQILKLPKGNYSSTELISKLKIHHSEGNKDGAKQKLQKIEEEPLGVEKMSNECVVKKQNCIE